MIDAFLGIQVRGAVYETTVYSDFAEGKVRLCTRIRKDWFLEMINMMTYNLSKTVR